MQSFSFGILAAHPISKVSNIIAVMWFRNNYRMNSYDTDKFIGPMILMLGAANICAGCFFIVPSLVYYMPICILVLCLVCIGMKVAVGWKYGWMPCRNWMNVDTNSSFITSLLRMMLYGFMIYFIVIYMFSSMSCAYSGQITGNKRWYMCLKELFKSSYCSNDHGISMNLADWRVYIIFMSWLFF